MPRPNKDTSSLEVVSRLQETAESIKLTTWQMRIVQALRLQGAAFKVVSANDTDLVVKTKPTTLVPHTLLKLFLQETITVSASPSSLLLDVTYSRLSRSVGG